MSYFDPWRWYIIPSLLVARVVSLVSVKKLHWRNQMRSLLPTRIYPFDHHTPRFVSFTLTDLWSPSFFRSHQLVLHQGRNHLVVDQMIMEVVLSVEKRWIRGRVIRPLPDMNRPLEIIDIIVSKREEGMNKRKKLQIRMRRTIGFVLLRRDAELLLEKVIDWGRNRGYYRWWEDHFDRFRLFTIITSCSKKEK